MSSFNWPPQGSSGAGTGSVTSVSVNSANGFTGSVTNPSSTPAITLTVSATGVLKANGTAISAATAGTDYSAGTSALTTGILKSTTSTGALTIATAGTDYVIPSGSITGTAANITATTNSTVTTLSALSLAGSQVTGNISGNAANITATTNGTITTLSALSLAGSQVTGNITGNAANITATTNATLTTLSALSLPASQLTGTTLPASIVTSSLTSVGTIATGTWNATTIGTSKGGTGVTSVTTSPTASSFAGWDVNKNLSANNLIEAYTSTATAAGTTTLVVGSTFQQFFTGSTTQTVVMPVTSTLVVGQQYQITNNSTGVVTVNSSGANLIQAMAAGTTLILTCILASGTTAASWSTTYSFLAGSGTTPLTTKGDLFAFSTVNARLPVGSDNKVALADSTAATGLSYQYPANSKNYVSNSTFESATTTNWSLGTVGTLTNGIPTGTPTFGSGASGNLSIATVSSGQLAGAFSLSYVSSAATTAGNMLASQAYAIDLEDTAKVLTFKFYYSAPTGASNCNFSGTSSNSFGIAIWDATNSSWLTSTANFGMTQSSGVGYVTGTCQTNSNTASLRFVVYNANATAGAATIYFDDFYLGPQTAPLGAVVTDWQTYSPTILGLSSVTGLFATWRRVGDSVEIMAEASAVTGTASTLVFPLPLGLTTDNTGKLPTAGTYAMVGDVQSGNAGLRPFAIATSGATSFGYSYQATTFTPALGNTQFGSGVALLIWAKIPIAGWSSNVQMSNDTDTRVITMRAYASGGPTSTASTPFVFDVVAFDNSGSYSNSTGKFTVPISGYYRVSHSGYTTVAGVTATVYVDGVAIPGGGLFSYNTSDVRGGSVTVKVNAGQTIDIRAPTSRTLATDATTNFLSIERLTGPSVIAATESVNAKYRVAGAVASSTTQPIVFATKVYDSHNAYNTTTGMYTAPVSGKYLISATTVSGTSQSNVGVYVSASQVDILFSALSSAANSGTSGYPLLAGQTIDLRYITSQNTNSDPTLTHFTIERVGN